ncbi:MAG: hypothetical protein IJM21_11705 [Clostridia bacterium]|nr:hypothetical protein [Clostridia bacterium]
MKEPVAIVFQRETAPRDTREKLIEKILRIGRSERNNPSLSGKNVV